MAETKESERVVHQALHGYVQGHQLLTASREFDHEIANILGHNSDSAPRARASDGPYLTGYPLPDATYVIARTWTDNDAERPNTVVTRSLILPRSKLPEYSAERLLNHLQQLTPGELATDRLKPIDNDALMGAPLTLTDAEAREASRYYRIQDRLAYESDEGRERIALALWQQLWMPARLNLQLCTAPDTTRFTKNDRPLLFTSESSVAPLEVDESAARHLIRNDLAHPGPFREFIHFVGSGEKAIGLIEPFAEAYELLSDAHPSVNELTTLLYQYRGMEPRRLRRLKRRFLSFRGHVPRWAVDPFDLLRALSHDDLGQGVYASDASLDRWLRFCWDIDPQRTASLLPDHAPDPDDVPAGPATAAEGIASAFASQASDLITADTLAIAATLSPRAALAAVWDRNEPALWRAWASLESQLDVPAGERPRDQYDWSVPLVASRHDARSLGRLLRRYPEALDHLIALADDKPADSDTELDLSRDAKRYVAKRLEDADLLLTGLARLSDHGTLPRRLDIGSWRRLLSRSTDETVYATAYLIARSAPTDHWEIEASSVAKLYKTLDGDGGADAWRRLSPHIRGDRNTWDRCGRLIEDYAHQIKRLDDATKSKALGLLDRRSHAAATAIAKRLRPAKSKKFSLFDPSTW